MWRMIMRGPSESKQDFCKRRLPNACLLVFYTWELGPGLPKVMKSVGGDVKTSTTELPMVDLEETCAFVARIHEKGLEAESMKAVATGLGYAAPTSTPCYRRTTSARLFGMMAPSSAELSAIAREYLRPSRGESVEEGRVQALVAAIRSVKGYASLMEKFDGKKVVEPIIANGMGHDYGLDGTCSLMCAKAFVQSLKFAGLLDENGILRLTHTANAAPSAVPTVKTVQGTAIAADAPIDDTGLETHYLTLDKASNRRVVVKAPASVTPQELKRVQEWLSFQLLVDDPDVKETTA